ncbi:hypothetical protein FNV43_RR07406 [Rhamnella rubrinervis]|uniref:Uncharacterized protein n=1 Tax=Rhamnella rubrinervis TaxID=2594499 RepID=A0A8K0MM59_9ROSA|nr:hypothetical protein FNV43_RR07406 [Rhamnella rubrinervis]
MSHFEGNEEHHKVLLEKPRTYLLTKRKNLNMLQKGGKENLIVIEEIEDPVELKNDVKERFEKELEKYMEEYSEKDLKESEQIEEEIEIREQEPIFRETEVQ